MRRYKVTASSRAWLIVAAFCILIIIGYTLFVSFPYLRGPKLIIHPVETILPGTITITGITERVAFLEINGYKTALNEDGSFSVERAYPSGYTAVTVLATDRFGRTITKSIDFIVDEHGNKKEK